MPLNRSPEASTASRRVTPPQPRQTILVRAISGAFLSFSMSAVLLTSPAAAQSSAALPASAAVKNFQVAAGPLNVALDSFGRSAGVNLTYAPELIQGLTTRGVTGTHSISTALDILLGNTGIEAVAQAGGGYSLRKNATVRTGSTTQDTSTLPAINVNAGRTLSTEGSGSYATPITAAATGLILSPRDTPQSVSVMTRQRMDDQELLTVKDILRNTPGITVNQFDTERSTFSARGFDVDNFQYDGVPTAYKVQYSGGESEMDSVIYDRVEVVRGATGLLTGAGFPSASINLVRKHADSKQFAGQVSLSAGSWNDYRGTVDLSTPVNADGSVRARVVAAYQDRESFTNYYSNKREIYYGVIDADLSPDTTISIGASYQKNSPQGSNWGGFPLWYSDGTRTDWDRSVTTAPRWAAWATEQTNVNGTLTHKLGQGWQAQLQGMYSEHTEDTPLVFAADWPDKVTGLGMTGYPNRYIGNRKQYSADFKLSGPLSFAGRTHELIVGGNYTRQTATFSVKEALDAQPLGNFLTWDGNYPQPAWGEPVLSEQYETIQYGVYGAARLSLSERLKLIVGGRLSRWDKDRIGFAGGSAFAFAQTRFIPYAGLVFDLNEVLSVYASYTDIFRPQESQDRSGNWLAPLSGKSIEAGLKGEFFDGQLNASIGVYEIRQDNLAEVDPGSRVPGTTTQAYRAVKGATSKGFEGEISGRITPDWNLSASFSHYQAKDYLQQDVNTLAPRTTARLFTTWRLPGSWYRMTLGGGINWQSQFYYIGDSPNGDQRITQGAFSTVSLMASYKFSDHLIGQLNIDNALDKKYININTYAQGTYGTPRSARATLTYKF